MLNLGRHLSSGDELFAVPWPALTADTDRKRLIFDVDQEVLEDAEGFTRDEWPDFADREFAKRVHDAYGVKPYWM